MASAGAFRILTCGHKRWYAVLPMNGDLVFCSMCDTEQRVTDIRIPEYRVKCEVNTCKFVRKAGQAKVTAEIIASKHRLKFPTHQVIVYAPDGSIHRRFGYGMQTLGD